MGDAKAKAGSNPKGGWQRRQSPEFISQVQHIMIVQTKEQHLERVFNDVARTTDAKGRPIDLGIMPAVLYLNVWGIETTFSCEGHLDHGEPFPWIWIDIGSEQALRRMVKAFGGSLRVHRIFNDTLELTCSKGTLPEQQAEMYRFAEWLRDKFFEDEEERP